MPPAETNRVKVAARLGREGWEWPGTARAAMSFGHPHKPGVIVLPRQSNSLSRRGPQHRQGRGVELSLF